MKTKSYNLFGTIWEIHFVDQVLNEKKDWVWGETIFSERRINISTKNTNGDKIPKNEIDLTILHEIVHTIFQSGQYSVCNNDEPLVEWTARCIKTLKDQHII